MTDDITLVDLVRNSVVDSLVENTDLDTGFIARIAVLVANRFREELENESA